MESANSSLGQAAADKNPRDKYVFSPEELRASKECSRESLIYRSLPMATFSGLLLHQAVQRGYLSGHPKYGAVPKILGAVAASWFLGKLSYINACKEKYMAIPNSRIGEQLRNQRLGYTPTQILESQGSHYETSSGSETKPLREFDVARSLNVDDKYKQNPGLEDRQRPNLDNSERLQRAEDYEAAMVESKKITSYEELQQQNRQEYRQLPRPSPTPESHIPLRPSPHSGATSGESQRRRSDGVKNQYGDEWEE